MEARGSAYIPDPEDEVYKSGFPFTFPPPEAYSFVPPGKYSDVSHYFIDRIIKIGTGKKIIRYMFTDRSYYEDYEIEKLAELDEYIGSHENLKMIVEYNFSESDRLKYLGAAGFNIRSAAQ